MKASDKSPEEFSRELETLRQENAKLRAGQAEKASAHKDAAPSDDHQSIRQLFDDYLLMYSSRDDRLTSHFSDDFSGFTGGGDFLVKEKAKWVAITRQDFAQIKDPIRIELKDIALQSLAETVVVATGFFTIHLPIEDHILSRETARLVLIFRKESAGWKISHSSISIPYHLVREGEVYPLKELFDRNQFLEKLVAERTVQLSEVNDSLRQTNEELATEIAQHNQTEDELRRNQQQYDNLVSKIPVGIYTLRSTPEGVFKLDYVSSRMADMVNASVESLLADFQLVLRAIHPDDLEGFVKLNDDGVRLLRPFNWTGRALIDGEVKWMHLTTTPEPQENGDVLWHGLAVDVTDQKRAEAEREKLEGQNRQLQKAESLSRMAGAIAHHFNNQLQAVMMSLELASFESAQNSRAIENLSEAMQSAREAAEVSSQMLTYLGQTMAKREPMDLSEVCQRSLSLLRAGMPRSVGWETDLPSPGPSIRANAIQIQQGLTNLVTNAWEASANGSGVIRLTVRTVSAEVISATHRFPIDFQPQDTLYACIEVADSGSGIHQKDIEKLFDPFFSTKFAGRGLGLPIVLGIARAYDGAVTVESEPGRGSTFRVFFPVTADAVPQKPIPLPSAAKSAGGGTLLVIEDEPAVLKGVVRALRLFGFKVFEAADGVEAVEVFRQYRDEISCVLCDLTMPRMNGWQTLASLRQLKPGIRFILASGYSEAQVMLGDHPELPQAFLYKPYELAKLRSTLGQVLATNESGH